MGAPWEIPCPGILFYFNVGGDGEVNEGVPPHLGVESNSWKLINPCIYFGLFGGKHTISHFHIGMCLVKTCIFLYYTNLVKTSRLGEVSEGCIQIKPHHINKPTPIFGAIADVRGCPVINKDLRFKNQEHRDTWEDSGFDSIVMIDLRRNMTTEGDWPQRPKCVYVPFWSLLCSVAHPYFLGSPEPPSSGKQLLLAQIASCYSLIEASVSRFLHLSHLTLHRLLWKVSQRLEGINSWPLNNTNLNCVGPLTGRFFFGGKY